MDQLKLKKESWHDCHTDVSQAAFGEKKSFRRVVKRVKMKFYSNKNFWEIFDVTINNSILFTTQKTLNTTKQRTHKELKFVNRMIQPFFSVRRN